MTHLRELAQAALNRGETVGRYHHRAVINAIESAVSPPESLNVTRLARALALVGPVDVADDMAGWNAYAADLSCAYSSKDADDHAPDWRDEG
jgi:hypothetical protein